MLHPAFPHGLKVFSYALNYRWLAEDGLEPSIFRVWTDCTHQLCYSAIFRTLYGFDINGIIHIICCKRPIKYRWWDLNPHKTVFEAAPSSDCGTPVYTRTGIRTRKTCHLKTVRMPVPPCGRTLGGSRTRRTTVLSRVHMPILLRGLVPCGRSMCWRDLWSRNTQFCYEGLMR